MNTYLARLEDTQFLLSEVLQAGPLLRQLPAYAEIDDALMQQVLEEASRFVAEVVAPLNAVGDASGCRFEAGRVTTPPGFKAAYQAFWQGGWPALSVRPEDGGQGLPQVLEAILYEMLSASNHGWTMAPGLLHGAYECLKHHASEALQRDYLAPVARGEWLATMCLTEPHAGSDLGLVRSRAQSQPDGSYQISGTKIFISGGEHDLTDNIVHLVLARLPDAPPGPKGLSLFLVPKVYPDGTRSAVVCERIEEKMGIHGSPTCVLRFDDARGWLIGDTGRGLSAMFVMMNAARLHVALQGIGLLDAAWQKAEAYARERRQMRAPRHADAARLPGPAPADPIIEHPAVRRILDTQRAWVDGTRVLAYRTALALDLAQHHPDAAARQRAQSGASLVTPILKTVCTHQGFAGASECLQVFGGHGYMREWGIEQTVRDARIAMIYEGTNEIQAIDLLLRKVLPDQGAALADLLDELATELQAGQAADDAALAGFAELREITATAVALQAQPDAMLRLNWIAGDYLRACALALLAWSWARIERAARTSDPSKAGTPAARWHAPAATFRQAIWPEFQMRAGMVRASCAPAA